MAIRHAHEETIHRLVAASSCRDVETSGHILRTGLLSEVLARAKGWSPSDAEEIRLAAPMHDVGKIGIPDAILRKPSKLTREEFEVMKSHTTIGADMLEGSSAPMLRMAQQIALSHHERWNGGGYPAGWPGPRFPKRRGSWPSSTPTIRSRTTASIVRRCPRRRRLEIMRRGEGKDFDPTLLALFFQNLPANPRESRPGIPTNLARARSPAGTASPASWPRWPSRHSH